MAVAVQVRTKVCTRCPERGPQPLDAFPKKKTNKRDGRGPWCKECQRAYAKRWYQGNEGKRQKNRTYYQENPGKFREYALLTKYGLTLEDYDTLLEEQGGVCAICNKPETARDGRSGKIRKLAVDHCHVTNRVRGLLCYRCNHLIGCLGDDAKSIERVLTYLRG